MATHRLGVSTKKWRRWIYNHIPEFVRKRDFELLTAFLCFTAGLALLLTGVKAGSMERALPTPVVMGWATILTLAPIAVVVGVGFAHKYDLPQAIRWVRVEASGLRLLAYSAYLYGVILVLIVGRESGATPFITFIFALTCHSRATYLTIKVEDYFALIDTVSKRPLDDLD